MEYNNKKTSHSFTFFFPLTNLYLSRKLILIKYFFSGGLTKRFQLKKRERRKEKKRELNWIDRNNTKKKVSTFFINWLSICYIVTPLIWRIFSFIVLFSIFLSFFYVRFYYLFERFLIKKNNTKLTTTSRKFSVKLI